MRRDILRKRFESEREFHAETRELDFRIRQLRRAEVDAEHLLQHELWDGYLQAIAALNEADEAALAGLLTSSDQGIYLSAEQCQKLEFERALLRAKIQARNECIQIPKAILQGSTSTGD